MRPTHTEFERDYYESLLIVLDTLERCLSSQVISGGNDTGIAFKDIFLASL